MLRTLSKHELRLLEKDLYNLEEPSPSQCKVLKTSDSNPESEDYISKFYTKNNNCKQFITDFYSYNFGTSPAACAISQQHKSNQAESPTSDLLLNIDSSADVFNQLKGCSSDDQSDDVVRNSSQLRNNSEIYNFHENFIRDNVYSNNGADNSLSSSSQSSSYASVSLLNSMTGNSQECNVCNDRRQLQRSLSDSSASTVSSLRSLRR